MPWIQADSHAAEIAVTGVSFGAYHAANFALKHAHVFPLALCQSGVYDVSVVAGGERGDAVYFNNPADYVGALGGDHLDWLRGHVHLLLLCGQGAWEDSTGALESTRRFARLLGEKGIPHELDVWGHDVPHDWPAWRAQIAHHLPRFLLTRTHHDRAPARHRGGLAHGLRASARHRRPHLLRRRDARARRGADHERAVRPPLKPRYSLVIDRLGWWYTVPREWLKKVSLMDDVYLLNNPFTFQAMEKHSAYCAMMRLGLRVPETWLIPHKNPPENERFEPTAERYNLPFELEEIAAKVGYPLYMKPFDGGQWVGVTRIRDDAELHAVYDASGERLMHLQAAVEDFDVFARSLSIGAETMVMHFDPDRPLHDRYQVDHDFLSPELGQEVVTISRLVNAFFRWEFNSCETIVKDGKAYPIDYANASPDVALTSLHYYFPWAIRALVRWSVFCAVTGRQMRVNQGLRDYFELSDAEDLSYEEKLAGYGELADAYFQTAEYDAFCAEHLAALDDALLAYVSGAEFDRLLVETVRSTFPAHEHDHFAEHYRGLLGAWVRDQKADGPGNRAVRDAH